MERTEIYLILPLVAGYLLDLVLGDPYRLPHPVRFYGLLITRGEVWLNKPAGAAHGGTAPGVTLPGAAGTGEAAQGKGNFLRGMGLTIFLGAGTFFFFQGLLRM